MYLILFALNDPDQLENLLTYIVQIENAYDVEIRVWIPVHNGGQSL
jgi:hypothetical protein